MGKTRKRAREGNWEHENGGAGVSIKSDSQGETH